MTQKITAIFGIAVLTAILLGGLTFSQAAFAGQSGGGPPGKVTICHIPPGDPSDFETLEVSQNALPAHLAHGDTLGPCLEEPTGDRITGCLCDLPDDESATDLPENFVFWVEDATDPETVEDVFAFCINFCGLIIPPDTEVGFQWNDDDPTCAAD